MKQRVTYIIRDPAEFHPKKLKVTKQSFSVDNLNAVKEQAITLGPSEIPAELWRVLRNCHELHVRWSTAQAFDAYPPFVSRITPGLHVSFTPLEGRSAKRLCELLKDAFGAKVKCASVRDAFTTPSVLSERFSSSASRQFYHFTPSLLDLSLYIEQVLCSVDKLYPCRLAARDLRKADTFDLDYDAISQTLVLKTAWTQANGDDGTWYEQLRKMQSESETLEVGVLMQESSNEEEELRFSGFLTQVGEDDQAKPTLFSTASRHHSLPQSHALAYKASFHEPTGIHPTLALSFSSVPKPPAPGCALHAYFTLPSTFFIDQYPFTDPLFLAAHNLAALHSISGATDLEAPDWTVPTWGSAALLELALPSSSSSSSSSSTASSQHKPAYEATLPLHTRYLAPANASHQLTPLPWPAIFWACPTHSSSSSKFASSSPFDRTQLGYDGLFGSRTRFAHVPPAGSVGRDRMVSTLAVPVLDLREAGAVEWGTVAVVLAGLGWVLLVLLRGVWKHGYGIKSQGNVKKSQ